MPIIAILLSLVIWGLVFFILWWGLEKIALPEPFQKLCTVILVVATVIVIIGILTGGVKPFYFLPGIVR